jgi:two-component system sensor histidine kinase TctE
MSGAVAVALLAAWALGSIAICVIVLLARRRRNALARELHELKSALTSARLAVDLMPILDLDKPQVCQAASDELERSFHTLGDFERSFHAPIMPRPARGVNDAMRRARSNRIDAHAELSRLAMIWGEAARREGRELEFEWDGPTEGVYAFGQRRRFVEVVTNLLANALRHGAGNVRLVVRVRSDALRIEVRDQGSGFGRPIATLARRRRGPHGHGLSVAMRSARRLGGEVRSAPSLAGATVVFTVPAIHSPAAVLAES